MRAHAHSYMPGKRRPAVTLHNTRPSVWATSMIDGTPALPPASLVSYFLANTGGRERKRRVDEERLVGIEFGGRELVC